MRTASVEIEGVSPLSWGRRVREERLPSESDADYEQRTWRYKFHVDSDGTLIIPPMALKNSLETAAKNYSQKIKGKGNATYTKHFASGVLVPKPARIEPKTRDDLEENWLFVPSNGQKGHGTRVDKCFPMLKQWAAIVQYIVLDDVITKDIFEQYVEKSGQFIGIGFFRPERSGYLGRFQMLDITWQ